MKRKMLVLSLILLTASYFTITACCDTTASTLKLDSSIYSGLGDHMNVSVTAPSYNLYKNKTEHIVIKVYSSEDPTGFYAYLQEENLNSDVFTSQISFSLSKSSATERVIKIKDGAKLYVEFEKQTFSASWKIYDAEVKLDRTSYSGLGLQPIITLDDIDLNLNPNIKEEATVNVSSTSYPKGFPVKLKETKPDSGIFTGNFGLRMDKADDSSKLLLISSEDTITVTYNDATGLTGIAKTITCGAIWKPFSGTLRLNKTSYLGLHSLATVTVTDQDINLRKDYKEVARVRLVSKSDPQGFIILATETGVNTGTFSGSFGFNASSTESSKKLLRINPSDTITATYTDDRNTSNKEYAINTATASFQYAEASILTSADNIEGSGNMLEITINDADANMPNIKDNIIIKVSSESSIKDTSLWLEETGTNTGIFKGKLYFTEEETEGHILQVYPTDEITIKYFDKTALDGSSKEVSRSINWKYLSTVMKFDKLNYVGYNTAAKVTLQNMDLNKSREKLDNVDVKLYTSTGSQISLELLETGLDSGEFTGTFYFGKFSNSSDKVLKAANNDIVYTSYTPKKDKNSKVECSAIWIPQDGQITLDRPEYKGNSSPVRITVKDFDIGNNINEKDELKVTAKMQGNARYTAVTLTETNKNTGIYTGTLYINGKGSNNPSIALSATDRLEIVYTDKDTKSGSTEYRTAYATWGGISVPKLTLDKAAYKGYDTYMTVSLNDSDQNKSTTVRDKVDVLVRAKSGKTNLEYTLTETGINTGIFTVKLAFTKEAPASAKVRVADKDEVTVTFKAKEVSAKATFGE
ncbi:MAG TPA: hypothetical protein VEB00_13975 [Clostridia bacterium]|nr:hypothetical protein [Clostridia bacterium]